MTGNPLYDILPEHGPALMLVLLLPIGAWLLRRRAAAGDGSARRIVAAYLGLPAAYRLLAWLLAVSGAVHLGLVFGHGSGGVRLVFLAAAVAGALVVRRLLFGGRWRRWAAGVLLVSIAGWWIAALAGDPPDQVALATKLVELTALAIVLRPIAPSRVRGLGAGILTIALVVMTGITGWIGAFAAPGAGDFGDGHHSGHHQGHHLGDIPVPGTVLPVVMDREPTSMERAAAEGLYGATAVAIARYKDPAVAAADGYNVHGLHGLDFHAQNTAYETDGRILDPERPEALVYAQSAYGPVLLGAVFQMPNAGQAGPAVGGPLTVWHAHENVCFSLLPPALSGLLSPLGSCPVLSINVPITAEMIHVWTVLGAPEPFGDLDEEWRRAYLADVRGSRS